MGNADAAGPLGADPSLAPSVAEASRRACADDAVLNAAIDRLRHRLGERLTSLETGCGWKGANGQPLHS